MKSPVKPKLERSLVGHKILILKCSHLIQKREKQSCFFSPFSSRQNGAKIGRSSRSQMFFRLGVLKNFVKFTEKRSLFFNNFKI